MIFSAANLFVTKDRQVAYIAYYVRLPRSKENRLFAFTCSKDQIIRNSPWRGVLRFKNIQYDYSPRTTFKIEKWNKKKVIEIVNDLFEKNSENRHLLLMDIFDAN